MPIILVIAEGAAGGADGERFVAPDLTETDFNSAMVLVCPDAAAEMAAKAEARSGGLWRVESARIELSKLMGHLNTP